MDDEKKERLFLQALEEESGDVIEVMELERPQLYDYLMRMTGDVTRALDTIEELYRVVAPQASHYKSWSQFRTLLYTTVRNFNLDAWNAETSNLENSGLKKITDIDLMYTKIDQYIRLLPGQHRETLICSYIYGLRPVELAKVVRRGEQIIAVDAEAILSDLSERSGMSKTDLFSRFKNFPMHQIKGVNSNNTVALSQVMGSMEEVESRHNQQKVKRYFFYIIILLIIVGAAGALGFLDEYLHRFTK